MHFQEQKRTLHVELNHNVKVKQDLGYQELLNNCSHRNLDPSRNKTEDQSEQNSRTVITVRAQLSPGIRCSPTFRGKTSHLPAPSL